MVRKSTEQKVYENLFVIISSISIAYTISQIEQHFFNWKDSLIACVWTLGFGVTLNAILLHFYLRGNNKKKAGIIPDVVEVWYVVLSAAIIVPFYWSLYLMLPTFGYKLTYLPSLYIPQILFYLIAFILIMFIRNFVNRKVKFFRR